MYDQMLIGDNMAKRSIRDRIRKNYPLKPVKNWPYIPDSEMDYVCKVARELMDDTKSDHVLVSTDEKTGAVTLTPDPDNMLEANPYLTLMRLPGYPTVILTRGGLRGSCKEKKRKTGGRYPGIGWGGDD